MAENLVHMRLGRFRFGMRRTGYTDLERHIDFALAPQERIFTRTSQQYMGIGEENVRIRGVLFPKDPRFGGMAQLNAMRGASKSYGLGSSLGVWHGRWFVRGITDNQKHFHPDGTPRMVEFTVELVHAG